MRTYMISKMDIVYLVTLVITFGIIEPLFANDLGVIGQTYSIEEEDFLDFIQHRIITMQNNGEWNTLQNQFRNRVKSAVDRPKPVSRITNTTIKKSWVYDPTIVVPYDLKDHHGRVFAKKGSEFNPLTVVSLKNSLVFIDGDNPKQVAWAKACNLQQNGKIKIILINGSIQSLSKSFLKPIYFDQEGRLTTCFHIQHVPAFVMQDGIKLKITEVVV